ncbi:ABC transporter permease [Pseudonocardia sp. C8]|uniref:ABC transporter permease n=1 Tax=Pseudonocardia sp. C8 TaxID=2762759 RepID=UPI001642D5DC|nr:ABC transporter permease [Pseudonocardia sp. C8]MBC3190430.1 ABC transporter permease [Pseudonocardia sp. C8]
MTALLRDTVADPAAGTPAPGRRPSWEILIPGSLLAVIVVACLCAPLLPGLADPNLGMLNGGDSGSRIGIGSEGHLLGTDALGRDLLARSIHGGRISIVVGLGSVLVGILVGGSIGIVAGYVGGAVDSVLMRVLDVLLALPSLVLALVVATYLGPSIPNLIIAISFFAIPSYARIARAGALSVRERDYVLSARLAGARAGHILVRHVTPRVVGSLLTYGLLICGIAIITEASLSFLGLGIPPPAPSWGSMMADGKSDLGSAPQIVLVPGLMLFLTVVSLNLLSDGIRNRLDRDGGAR